MKKIRANHDFQVFYFLYSLFKTKVSALKHDPLSPTVLFSYFRGLKHPISTGKSKRLDYQIALKPLFPLSGSHYGRVINIQRRFLSPFLLLFPQKNIGFAHPFPSPVDPMVNSRLNFAFLKNPPNLINQNGSNYTAITAKKSDRSDLFLKRHLAGNNCQQQSNRHYPKRNLGQNDGISQVNHNLSNNFSVFAANNQHEPNQNTTRSEKTAEATFKLADDIFINSVYHNVCN